MFKEIKTPIGKCFYLYTDEKATTEQKFQGRNVSYLLWKLYKKFY